MLRPIPARSVGEDRHGCLHTFDAVTHTRKQATPIRDFYLKLEALLCPGVLGAIVAELDYNVSSSLSHCYSTTARLSLFSPRNSDGSRSRLALGAEQEGNRCCVPLVARPGLSQLLELALGSAKDPNNRHNYLSTIHSLPTRPVCR